MKKIFTYLFVLLIMVIMCSCGSDEKTVTLADNNSDGKISCTIEVRCDNLLSQLDNMTKEKAAIVPSDGIIVAQTEIMLNGGETVFDILRSTLKEEKIHFEYVDASVYKSVYIEGIANLYEYDCGPQSGWMYSVNDVFPGVGCSAYTVNDGDKIVFAYTCNLGVDLGEDYSGET